MTHLNKLIFQTLREADALCVPNEEKVKLLLDNIWDIRIEDLEEFIRTKNIRVNNVHRNQDTCND